MEALEGEPDPVRAARRRLGIILGVIGLLILFGAAASLRFVPESWQIIVLVLIGVGAAVLVVAYVLVR